MIALPGLTLATGRADVARQILLAFAGYVDGGMLPNNFPDAGGKPEYNTVDAALWYFEAVRQYFAATQDGRTLLQLFPTLADMIDAHVKGTRYNIHVDPADGLLYAGGPGVQLTWMDAQSRRLGGDAADGQAGGSECAVDQCAGNHRGIRAAAGAAQRGLREAVGQGAEEFSEILERGARLLFRCDRRRRMSGNDASLAAESDFCGVTADESVDGRAAEGGGGCLRATSADVVRIAQPGAGRARLSWGTMAAGRAIATRLITRGRCGAGCSGRLRWRICACTETASEAMRFLEPLGISVHMYGLGTLGRNF